jgi:hypothetical protein
VGPEDVGPDDVEHIRRATPEVVGVVRALLDRISAGELALAPSNDPLENARESWL